MDIQREIERFKQLEKGPLQEMSRRKVIAEYNSLEEMVKDGWRLD